jgi:hypothetical protein
LPAKAAAITARRQSEKDASCLIRQIKARLALKKSEEGGRSQMRTRRRSCSCADIGYGLAAELDLRLDAAAHAPGDLQAGRRMLNQEAGTGDAAAAWRRPVPAGASLPVGQPVTLTFSAWGPFWPRVTSNSTFCPSSRPRSPPPVIALLCTNTSGPPWTAMKP